MAVQLIVLVAIVALAILAAVAVSVWRARRRARRAELERGEVEARVAERVRALSHTTEPAEQPRPATTREAGVPPPSAGTGAPVATSTASAEGAAVDSPTERPAPRMVPIAAPDIDRVYAPRRPTAAPVVASPVRATSRPSPRRRSIAVFAIAVLVVAVTVIASGPVLGGLFGIGRVTPTATEVAARPTPTATPPASPALTPTMTILPTPAAPSGTPQPTAAATPPPGGTPLPTPHVYVVRSGDTLWQIAQTFDIGLSLLIAANPQIHDPSVILPGERVAIPTPTPAP